MTWDRVQKLAVTDVPQLDRPVLVRGCHDAAVGAEREAHRQADSGGQLSAFVLGLDVPRLDPRAAQRGSENAAVRREGQGINAAARRAKAPHRFPGLPLPEADDTVLRARRQKPSVR